MRVLVVLPIYNEEQILENNVSRVVGFFRTRPLDNVSWTVVLSDNGSTDRTPIIGPVLASQYSEVKYIRAEKRGKGVGIRNGWSIDGYDAYLFTDADLTYDLSSLPALVQQLMVGCDVVSGSRLLAGSIVERHWLRKIITRIYNNYLLRILFLKRFTDAQAGCKGLSGKARDALLKDLTEDGWFFESQFLLLAERRGYRICDIEIICRDPRKWRLNLLRTMLYFFRKVMSLRIKWWLA